MKKSSIDETRELLDQLLSRVDKTMERAEKDIPLNGKRLDVALKEQVDLQFEWELLATRANKIHQICEEILEATYAKAVSDEMTTKMKRVSISEAKEYAKANHDYRKARRLLIDAKEAKEEVRGGLETVNSRKYILNNITNSVIAGCQMHII